MEHLLVKATVTQTADKMARVAALKAENMTISRALLLITAVMKLAIGWNVTSVAVSSAHARAWNRICPAR